MIEEAVSAQATSNEAFNRRNLDHRIFIRLPAVVPDKVMAAGNVKMTDFHDIE